VRWGGVLWKVLFKSDFVVEGDGQGWKGRRFDDEVIFCLGLFVVGSGCGRGGVLLGWFLNMLRKSSTIFSFEVN
jgi:hypothetical protein